MGKRELVIALAFIVVGVIAYQATAPAPRPGEPPLSISRLWNLAGGRMRANMAHATVTKEGTVAADATWQKLRLIVMGPTRQVRIVGETRADIAYYLAVESTGPDQATATTYAQRVAVKTDDLGHELTLRVDYPRDGRQTVALTIHVPSRLGLIVSSPVANIDATNVASVHMDNITGESRIASIAGEVTGTYRNGSLHVSDVSGAGTKLSVQRTRATFENIPHGVAIDLHDGECRISGTRGPVDIDETRADVTVTNATGPVHVTGADGRVTLDNPLSESTIDTHRTEVEVRIAQAVPMTVLTTDDTLRLLLVGSPNISVDAAATMGQIQAGDFGLQPETIEQEARLTHVFGRAPGARVSLRAVRGTIVIKNFRESIVNRNRK